MAELPPRTETILRVQLQDGQRRLYEAVRTTADKQVRRALERQGFEAHKSPSRCPSQTAPGLLRKSTQDWSKGTTKTAHTMERAKLELLADLLPALVDEGRRVLVFSQFTEMLALTAEMLDTLALPLPHPHRPDPPRSRGRGGAFRHRTKPARPFCWPASKRAAVWA